MPKHQKQARIHRHADIMADGMEQYEMLLLSYQDNVLPFQEVMQELIDVHQVSANTEALQAFDRFQQQKNDAYIASLPVFHNQSQDEKSAAADDDEPAFFSVKENHHAAKHGDKTTKRAHKNARTSHHASYEPLSDRVSVCGSFGVKSASAGEISERHVIEKGDFSLRPRHKK